MPSSSTTPVATVALIGNPNTGKSTLFCALAGVRQKTGNYPGVTIEKKIGRMDLFGRSIDLVDLPGTYSLAPRSPDEMIAVDVLLGRCGEVAPIDAVLSIIDASNLERNLYLVSQVLELGIPVVVVLNMTDVAEERGITIDVSRLAARLDVPVTPIQANRRVGLGELKKVLAGALSAPPRLAESPMPAEFQQEVEKLERCLIANMPRASLPRFLIERLLLDSGGYLQNLLTAELNGRFSEEVDASRRRLAEAGQGVPAVEAIARYGWIGRTLEDVVVRRPGHAVSLGDRVDRLLTHKFLGSGFFLLMMLLVFTSVFEAAEPLNALIDRLIGLLGDRLESILPEGALQSLMVNGVIGGAGSVLAFIPQIGILFLFIAVLEDCGYMARAAYLMDKLMSRVGLSGKSFIPLLSSFACAIPGIMAARVIENRRDRLATILVAPLMSCSARLPVYTILASGFIPDRAYLGGVIRLRGLTLAGMYFLGIVAAAGAALVLKKTLLRGPAPPFVLELPSYKWPSFSNVLQRMLDRVADFVRQAGTLILAVSVIVWAAAYYPHDQSVEEPFQSRRGELERRLAAADGDAARAEIQGDLAELKNAVAAAYQRQSILGRLGRFVEPAVRPLGWDWKIGCAVIASFPAREVVMGSLGVIYHLGEELDVGEASDRGRLQSRLQAAVNDETGEKAFNIPVALSIMVFFALCAQCASTLVVIKRESGSWLWSLFTFVYMTTLAYLGALVTYQIGMLAAV